MVVCSLFSLLVRTQASCNRFRACSVEGKEVDLGSGKQGIRRNTDETWHFYSGEDFKKRKINS